MLNEASFVQIAMLVEQDASWCYAFIDSSAKAQGYGLQT